MRSRSRILAIFAVAAAAIALWWSARTDPPAPPCSAQRPPPAPAAPGSATGSTPALRFARAGGQGELPAIDRERIVRHAYERFRRYTGAEPAERVEIALDDFRDVEPADLDSVALYPDLATLGSDWALVATPHVTQRDDGRTHVRYHAEWQPAENLARRAGTAAFLGKSAAEVLRLGDRRLAGDRSRTLALTSYRVTASFGGQSEIYRAAFRWFLDRDDVLHFSIVDGVLHGLALALAETAPPSDGDRPPEVDLPSRQADRGAPACVERRSPLPVSKPAAQQDQKEHELGEHRSLFAMQAECSCDGECVSVCEARVVTARCEDVGRVEEPWMVHRVQGRAAAQTIRATRGDQHPADCLAAFDCYVERCFAAECGEVAIHPQPTAPGARFALSADLVTSYRSAHETSCGPCERR